MPSQIVWRDGRPEVRPSQMWAVRKSPHNATLAWDLDNSDEIYELPFQVEPHSDQLPPDPSFKYTPNVICNACRAILQFCKNEVASASSFGRAFASRISVDYGLAQLQQSAVLGCHLCSIFETCTLCTIRDGKPSSHRLASEDNDSAYIYFDLSVSGDEDALFNLKVWHGNDSQVTGIRTLRIYPLLNSDETSHDDNEAKLSPSLGRYTGDGATFALARDWLHECKDQHQHSAAAGPSQALSIIRLLFLYTSNTQIAARLIDYAEERDYVALSHCWGDQSHVPKLLKATEARMREGIDLSAFPQTFLDAIEITIRLGYEYLWIDSLCIIQDAQDDWTAQSSVMSLIYQASVLTIAALKSSDSRGGCFTSSRNPLALRTLFVEELGIQVEPLDKSQIWQLEVDTSGPFASPLHTRGWVIQERLSAPRTLYYGSLGIYWECREKIRSESYVEAYSGFRDRTKKYLREALVATAGSQSAQNTETDTQWEQSFQTHWHKFLELYTPCLLTYPTDKLMAIKGIVGDIERSGCGPNLLGLWTDNLAGELLWRIIEAESVSHDTFEPRGRLENDLPSWTWASVHGRIEYPFPAGSVDWEAYINRPNLGEKALQIHTYRRSVEIVDGGEIALLRLDANYAGWGGDYDEEHSWSADVELHPVGLLWIILIQRAVISEQPRLRVARCLLVRKVNQDNFERLGSLQVRYGPERDNPFNSNGRAETEVIRLV